MTSTADTQTPPTVKRSFLPTAREKRGYVKKMFDQVASKYDFLNHLLSLGIDTYWRRRAIKLINFKANPVVLDLACGTGDLAIQAAKAGATRILAMDLSMGMLRYGRKKIVQRELENIEVVCADAEQLPLPDDCVDAITIGFGIRNVADIPACLAEMNRVLVDSGVLVILEFSQPRVWPLSSLYRFYFKRILPLIGSLISKDKSAYHYLPESVSAFPARDAFSKMIQTAGFDNVRLFDLTFGVATIYCGLKG